MCGVQGVRDRRPCELTNAVGLVPKRGRSARRWTEVQRRGEGRMVNEPANSRYLLGRFIHTVRRPHGLLIRRPPLIRVLIRRVVNMGRSESCCWTAAARPSLVFDKISRILNILSRILDILSKTSKSNLQKSYQFFMIRECSFAFLFLFIIVL